MRHVRFAIGLSVLLVTGCSSQSRSPTAPAADALQTMSDRRTHARAVEAAIWGMPAVNFDRMLQAALANGAKANQVVFWSRPVNWKDQTLTPNTDTIYLNPFYDTREGPVVLEIPPVDGEMSITGSVDTAWQNALEDVGPAGADKGKGGKYLITPPGYAVKPPDGYIVLASDTYQGFAILRSNFKSGSDADIARAVDYGKRVKIYPLGADPQSSVHIDVYDKLFDATIPYDVRYFESLNRVVQTEPWLTRDKAMIDVLKSLGIEKGKALFAPDAKTKAMLDEAADEARAYIDARYERALETPITQGARWGLPAGKELIDGMANGFADADRYPIDDRAVMYAAVYYSAKHLGAGQFYMLTIKDKAGQPLRGSKSYALHVPPNAPVRLYWSATAYDRATHALIRDVSRASRGSNATGIEKNADGSVDVYFGPSAPAGKEANWVPTAGRDFEVLFRLYGPEKAFFDKTWILPDVEDATRTRE